MVSVIIPIYNAADTLFSLLERLREQTLTHELILIDSESDLATQNILDTANVSVTRIRKAEFNHGTTRNLGLQLANYETVVFLTQDALPASSGSLERLVNMLHSREDIAMAYGRQLPHSDTGVFGRFARITNYPTNSMLKSKEMISQMGIKTCSCSNSFAAYKKTELLEIGGFPTNTILGEDVSIAARFILQGKMLAYCAEAEVYHAHDYSLFEEFKRYFDIGVFHHEQRNVLNEFTKAESEGFKYVLDEWKYLQNNGYVGLIPEQIIRTIAKYAGYKLGRWEQVLPLSVKKKFSMHRSFWLRDAN